MDLDSLAEYLGMLSPLAVGMLVVPLADQRGLPLWLREWYRNGPVTPIGAKQHFTYSEKALETGRWWTLFTYVLHHQNIDHLAGNLLGLVLFGRPVYEKFHTWGFYATFFSGSVISALDLTQKRFQISTAIGVMMGNPFPQRWESLHGWYNQGVSHARKFLTPYISQYVDYKGASAGVYSIMGACACVDVEKLVSILLDPSSKSVGYLLSVGWNASMLFYKCYAEWRMLQTGQGQGIDHAGHVDGFVIGVGCYTLFRVGGAVWGYYLRRRRWRSGGRRLGGADRDQGRRGAAMYGRMFGPGTLGGGSVQPPQ